MSYLPTVSALYLHRCSKALAARCLLNQRFWRDQLISGKLNNYLWDLNASECRLRDVETHDWKLLAKTLAGERFLEQMLHNTLQTLNWESTTPYYGGIETLNLRDKNQKMADPPLGLVNRCRIVRIVQDIVRIDKLEAKEPYFPFVEGE